MIEDRTILGRLFISDSFQSLSMLFMEIGNSFPSSWQLWQIVKLIQMSTNVEVQCQYLILLRCHNIQYFGVHTVLNTFYVNSFKGSRVRLTILFLLRIFWGLQSFFDTGSEKGSAIQILRIVPHSETLSNCSCSCPCSCAAFIRRKVLLLMPSNRSLSSEEGKKVNAQPNT